MKRQSLLRTMSQLASALPRCLITYSYILHSPRGPTLLGPVLHSCVWHKSPMTWFPIAVSESVSQLDPAKHHGVTKPFSWLCPDSHLTILPPHVNTNIHRHCVCWYMNVVWISQQKFASIMESQLMVSQSSEHQPYQSQVQYTLYPAHDKQQSGP